MRHQPYWLAATNNLTTYASSTLLAATTTNLLIYASSAQLATTYYSSNICVTPPEEPTNILIIPLLIKHHYTIAIAIHHGNTYQMYYRDPDKTTITTVDSTNLRAHIRREVALTWPIAVQAHLTPPVQILHTFQQQVTEHDCGVHILRDIIQLTYIHQTAGMDQLCQHN